MSQAPRRHPSRTQILAGRVLETLQRILHVEAVSGVVEPIGVMSATWLTVQIGWGRLPPGVSWPRLCLIGLLAGIGFTMSIFIALLAFEDESSLGAAKLGFGNISLPRFVLGLALGQRHKSGAMKLRDRSIMMAVALSEALGFQVRRPSFTSPG